MRHLSTIFLTATVLAFAGASTAVAQPAGETDYVFTPKELHDGEAAEVHNEAKSGEKTPATLPLPEAKKRYQEKERQLRDLAEGKTDLLRRGFELINEERLAHFDVLVVDRRDQVRQAVAEAFDARQQLQAAELAELERRIASIKRAMALRETMKETIIDQRTEELIEQIEAAEKQPKQPQQGGAATTPNKPSSQSQAPGYPGATREMIKGSNGGETEIARQKRRARQRQQQILELDVDEAQAKLDLAERAYKRFEQLLANGAIDKAVFDEEATDYKQARIRLEAAKVHLEAFLEAHRANAAGDNAPDGAKGTDPFGADDPNVGPQARKRLLQLDVQEAEQALAAAERAYKRGKALHDTGSLAGYQYDKLSEELNHAKIQLERAKVKLRAHEESSATLAEKQLSAARQSLKSAEQRYNYAKKMREKGYVTQDDVDAKSETLNAAKAQLNQARAIFEAMGKSDASADDDGAGTPPAQPDPNSAEQSQRLLELDVEKAEATFDAAKRDYDRVNGLHDTRAVEQSVLDQKGKDHEIAKIRLERAKVKLEAAKHQSRQDGRSSNKETAEDREIEFLANHVLAQLDVQEAEANLAAAELQYERYKRHYAEKAIEKSLLDEQADKYQRALKQLERANIKLMALSNRSTSALAPASEESAADADAKDSLTITLAETGDGKPAAVYLTDGKAGAALSGTTDEQDNQIRQAVEQGVNAGKPSVLIKAEKGVAHRDVLRVSEAAGSVEGVSIKLAAAEGAAGSEQENAR